MFKETVLNETTLPNGVVQRKMTANKINFFYGLCVIVGLTILYSIVSGKESPLQMCQQSYMKATNEIMRYNEENPQYPIALPVYNCNNNLTKSGASTPPPSELNLRKKFGLENCRFINDFHRLGKYELEWKAYDIACELGKSFDVRSPSEYTIEKIGYGVNLGNYIILKKSSEVGDEETRIVLGHTRTSRKTGEQLAEGDIVGQTDISGASTGIHVHIELWGGWFNVSREFAIDKPYTKINGTALLNHRGWNFGQPKESFYFTHYDLGDVKQNDASPCNGASGKDLCEMERNGIRTMAITSDIRNKYKLNFGDKVRLIGDEGCAGVYQVEDEMNKRFRQTPGILRPGTPYYIKGDIPSMEGGVCGITKL